MNAIRALFVAIAGIQVAMSNPFPRLVAWIALTGQLVVPILSVMRKHGVQGANLIVLSAIIAGLTVVLATRSVALQPLLEEKMPKIKMKVFSVLLLSTLIFVGLARVSPEISIVAYLVFAFLPIKKALDIEVENGISKLN
jgi:hypothetical protein